MSLSQQVNCDGRCRLDKNDVMQTLRDRRTGSGVLVQKRLTLVFAITGLRNGPLYECSPIKAAPVRQVGLQSPVHHACSMCGFHLFFCIWAGERERKRNSYELWMKSITCQYKVHPTLAWVWFTQQSAVYRGLQNTLLV